MEQKLQQWLACSGLQRRTQAAIDDFAQGWNDGPVHGRFDAALASLPNGGADAVADAIHELFADDDWLEALVGGLADRLRDDPFFEPPFRALNSDVHSGLIVFEDPRASIAVGVADVAQLAAKKRARRGSTSVGFSGRVTVLKFVKAGGATISLWEAPPITGDFTAAGAGRCERVGERRLADGDVITVDGRRQSYVIERARANLLVVQAEINVEQAPLSVEYDSATLAYVGCSATGDSASRIQMIATLLRRLGCDRAFDPLRDFLGHPDFFVRWHVMKELLGIDADRALPHLERMARDDPHPEARRTARLVLGRLEAAPLGREAA